jgi:hypothetical protein
MIKSQVRRTTLSDRFQGKHHSQDLAHEDLCLLTNAEEEVVLQWLEKVAMEEDPFDMKALQNVVYTLCQKIPGKQWCNRLLKRHSDRLTLAKATGLDPMRGKNFNKPTVKDYFDQFAVIKEKYGDILASQIWNMDEKGI